MKAPDNEDSNTHDKKRRNGYKRYESKDEYDLINIVTAKHPEDDTD